MCKVLSKSGVDELLQKNGIEYKIITAYINGTNRFTSWTFSNEMKRDVNFFPKNLELKLEDFFKERCIEIPQSYYIDDERRGKSSTERVTIVDKALNNCSPKMKERYQGLGWKMSFLQFWFGNSSGKFYNMLGRNSYIDVRDWKLLAYMGRCKDTALPYGGGQVGLYNDSEFCQGSLVKSEWLLKPDFFKKYTDKEIDKMLGKIGLPRHFYNEAIAQRFRFLEDAIIYMAEKWNVDFEQIAQNQEDVKEIPMDQLEKECEDKTTLVTPLSVPVGKALELAAEKYNDAKREFHPNGLNDYERRLSSITSDFLDGNSEDKNKLIESVKNKRSNSTTEVRKFADIIRRTYMDIPVDDLKKLGDLCHHLAAVKEIIGSL